MDGTEDLVGKTLDVKIETTSDTPQQAQPKAVDTSQTQGIKAAAAKQPQRIFNSMTYDPNSKPLRENK